MYKYMKYDYFEQGVPARDLTKDEWDKIDPETQKRLLDSGVYKAAKLSEKKEGE